MPVLTADKIAMLKGLVAASPDHVVRALEKAVCKDGSSGPLAAIGALVEAESADRSVRAHVLAPVAAMFGPPRADGRPVFPRPALSALWRGLRADKPDWVKQAMEACYYLDPDEPAPEVFDFLCARAASGLSGGTFADYVTAASICESARPGSSQSLILALEIAPLLRQPVLHLQDWLQRMTDERRAIARLAYRDAGAAGEGGGPLMFEMLAAHLPQPTRILRVVSAIMDHPGERYLAASELAMFGERALGEIEIQVERVRTLRPGAGLAVAREAAGAVQDGIEAIKDFEQSIQLSRDAPWGKRVVKLKQGMAAAVEARLREIDEAATHALPVEKLRYSGRLVTTAPKLDGLPDQAAVTWALGLLTFADEIRGCAADGGFGTVRAKVLDTLGKRIDQYAEDVLEQIRLGEVEDEERAREHLEVAARLLTLVRDKQAGGLIRRRAAAA